MTGFGKGVAVSKHRRFTVEIRSVNSKQLDLNLKVPGLYRAAEIELRSIVNRALRRGKVDLFLTVERTDEGTSVRIDEAVFAAYADQLRRAAGSTRRARAGTEPFCRAFCGCRTSYPRRSSPWTTRSLRPFIGLRSWLRSS